VFGDVAFAQAPFAALGGATLFSSVSESATGSDAYEQFFQAGALVQELATATDAAANLGNILVAARAETATATDTTNFAASTLAASYYDGVAATDAYSTAGSNYLVTVAETATATSAQSAIATLYAAVEELATGEDEVDGGRGFTVAITESATGADVNAAGTTFPVSVQEAASVIDAVSVLKTANVYPQGLQLNVYVGQVLVWGTIPTEQPPPDPDWTDIPT
jgi:hypothetical protein